MKRSKLIFLDFDGVLNDPYWLGKTWPTLKKCGMTYELDSDRIRVLAQICDITKAEVVLSSMWSSRPGIDVFLEKFGCKVVGRFGIHSNRGATMKKWLQGHPKYKGADYVILDDEKADYDDEQLKHLVFTGSKKHSFWTKDTIQLAHDEVGLRREHIDEVLKKLKQKEPEK